METVNQEVNPALVEDTWAHDEEESTAMYPQRLSRGFFSSPFFFFHENNICKPLHTAKFCQGGVGECQRISYISYSIHMVSWKVLWNKKMVYRKVQTDFFCNSSQGCDIILKAVLVSSGWNMVVPQESSLEYHLLLRGIFWPTIWNFCTTLQYNHWNTTSFETYHSLCDFIPSLHTSRFFCVVKITWLQSSLGYVLYFL